MKYLSFLVFAVSFVGANIGAIHAENDPYNSLIWNRDNFQSRNGAIDTGDWFEWWYYKVVVPETNEAFFFVYGVVNPWDKSQMREASRAYVGFGSYADGTQISENLSVDEFEAHYDKTFIRVGKNQATNTSLQAEISNEHGSARWNIQMKKNWGWNAMGWGMGVPKISNIFWYPAQADAVMNGSIEINGRKVELKNAPAYQDRNWGRSFPKWWTWLVSNHFDKSPGTVLAAGGGKPAALSKFFLLSGLCIGLKHKGKEYIFRTTDGDLVNFEIRFGKWEVNATNKKGQRIKISAYAPPEKFLLLSFQSPQGPSFYDYEALKGDMRVQLLESGGVFNSWEKAIELRSSEAGIEYGSPDQNGLNALFSTTQSLR